MSDTDRLNQLRLWHRAGIAVLATTAAWLVTYLLMPELRADSPIICFPLAVIFSAYLAGPVAALISTGLGALLAAYFFLPPEGLVISGLHDQIRLLLFIFMGGAISLLAQALQRFRRRAETRGQALRETEERLRMAADAVDVGVWQWDIERDELAWSDRCKMLFGLSAEVEVTPATFQSAVYPEDLPNVVAARSRALIEHADYDIEFRAIWPDGTTHWILGKGRGLYDADGAAVRMHGIALDITQRKKDMEQLRQLNETLERRVAERSALAEQRTRQVRSLARELSQVEQQERHRLAMVLHDHLQQLLVGARLNMSLLQSQPDPAEAKDCARQVDELLKQSLTVTRTLTAELNPPVLDEGNLPKALEWLAGWMHDKHRLEVILRVEGNVEPVGRSILLLLFQSVRELLFNVVKHAHVDQVTVTISQPDGEHIRVVVEDQGNGFDPAEAPAGNRRGSGLGLASVRERLELLDGCVRVESHPGQGARITLEAPVRLQA